MANQPQNQPMQPPSNNKPFVWLAVLAVIGLAIVALAAIGNQQPISVNTGNNDRNILTSTGTHVLPSASLKQGIITDSFGRVIV